MVKQEAANIVSSKGAPHWINATNPEKDVITWSCPSWLSTDTTDWTFSNWDENSQHPNDCVVPETCIFIGPHGKVSYNVYNINLSETFHFINCRILCHNQLS